MPCLPRRRPVVAGNPDESQIEWTAAEGRALVTFNVAHFAELHATWMRHGRRHYLSHCPVPRQRPIGDMVRRLLHLANT